MFCYEQTKYISKNNQKTIKKLFFDVPFCPFDQNTNNFDNC